MSDDLVRTLVAPATVEAPPISGSRFVGHIAPVRDEAAASTVLDARRREDADASHHCWAWVLADGRHRADDDGEPRDTAGVPILRHVQGAGLVDAVVVVTRWFGGTKLGRGGLVRAYGDTAAAVIEAATIVDRYRTVDRRLEYPYDLTAAVDGVLAAHDAEEASVTYAATVSRVVRVRRSRAAAFDTALRDATAGRVDPT